MKKISIILLTIAIMFSLIGCSSKSVQKQESASQSNDEVDVDEGLLMVTINIPNSFFEFCNTTAEDYVNNAKSDPTMKQAFNDVVLNNDGSVSLTMTKNNYDEFMIKFAESINNSIQDLKTDESYSNFKEIKTNDDFTEFDIILENGQLSITESFSYITFFMYGKLYQMFKEDPNNKIKVSFYDAENNLIETKTYDENEDLN